MRNRYLDFEELWPIGEASHIPDTRLDDGVEGDPRRQRVATTTGGYPDEPTATDGECRSCGASIPDGQTKCRFCLTNHLGSDATSTDESASTTFLGIVHLVVESTTFYGAVGKGGAAAKLLSANEAESAETTTRSSTISTRRRRANWPSNGPLPDAVQVSSAEGEGLLSAARDRTGRHSQEASERQEQAPTLLYDQRGDGIRDASRLDAVLDYTDDEDVALAEYMVFKNEVVSQLECTGPKQRWRLTGDEIETVVGAGASELIAP